MFVWRNTYKITCICCECMLINILHTYTFPYIYRKRVSLSFTSQIYSRNPSFCSTQTHENFCMHML